MYTANLPARLSVGVFGIFENIVQHITDGATVSASEVTCLQPDTLH